MTAPEQPSRVAFLGLGAMGFAMSTHLVRQGVAVIGFDIWKPTLEKFEAACQTIEGAVFSTTSSAAEAVEEAAVILLMVATHHHVNSALFDSENPAVKSIPQGGTIIITSTVPPTYPAEVRRRLDIEFSRPDIRLIDAPVSGGTVRSANGTLTIMSSSNDPETLANPSVEFILSNLSSKGKSLYKIPGTLGAGTSTKALNQVQCAIHIVAGSEIMALAAVKGLDTLKFYNAMKAPDALAGKQRYGWTWMFENRGPRMFDPNLPISSAMSIINKDAGILKDEESRLNIELPLLNQAHAQLLRAMEAGMASVDDAWLNRLYLGLNTLREVLVVSQSVPSPASPTSLATQPASPATRILSDADQDNRTDILLLAHALINFQSAYETFAFAEALDLRGDTQRDMWFTIIAGAAGASRVFSEVIPVAFAAVREGRRWEEGFLSYAKDVFGTKFASRIADVDRLVTDAQAANVQPVLLETALAFVKQQLA